MKKIATPTTSFKNELEYKGISIIYLQAKGYMMQAHEDSNSKFIADLSFSGMCVDGWIEVKWCAKAPKTVGSIEHWTKGQEEWLRLRGQQGSGHCYLLVGTPIRHVLWKWNMLPTVRDVQWEKACSFAEVDEPDLKAFADRFWRRVRIRGG